MDESRAARDLVPTHARNPGWIAAAAVLSGLSTYVLLSVVARGVGPDRFDAFSLYWAVLILVSVGGYLPLEQIVSRHRAGDADQRQLRRWAERWGGATAVLGTLLLVGVALAEGSGGLSPAVVVTFAVNLSLVALQAALRGLAAGSGRLDVYSAVVGTDATIRTLACAGLAAGGVHHLVAYTGAIAIGCGMSVVVGRVLLGPQTSSGDRSGRDFSREAGSLVPAALSMQLLLNSAVLVAYLDGSAGTATSGTAGAGALLAIGSLARTSVFTAQAAQAAYVGRIAALVHHQDPAARRWVRLVLWLAVLVAIATAVGSWLVGPEAVRLLYGSAFVSSRSTCLLVGAGIGLFLVAMVANDLTVAVGRHANAGRTWVLGSLVAVVSVALLRTDLLRVTLPLLLGSGTALMGIALWSSSAGGMPNPLRRWRTAPPRR